MSHLIALRVTARRLWHSDDSGVALVEFALILPLLVVLLFGMIDFGKAFNYWIDENHLASEAARYAAVGKNPGVGGGMTLADYIKSQADSNELKNGSGSVTTPVQVCVTYNGTGQVGDSVTVTVRSRYTWLSALNLGIVGGSPINTDATMRIERLPASGDGTIAGCST